MAIDGFYPDYPDWPFSPDGVHHRDYHDEGPYHHHPLNPPNDMFHRPVADERCAGECDDQLAVFSTVGRGLKGDGYKVRLIEGDSGETFLEGLRQDSATGEYSRDWISDNIDGGKLTYKYTMHPFTSPKTFTITFAYHKTGDEGDDWTWTTPSIPYIWGDEDINVPSIEAFDGLQEQIDALQSLIDGLLTRMAEAERTNALLFNALCDVLDHVYGWEHRTSSAFPQYTAWTSTSLYGNQYPSSRLEVLPSITELPHNQASNWKHCVGGDVYTGPVSINLRNLSWIFSQDGSDAISPEDLAGYIEDPSTIPSRWSSSTIETDYNNDGVPYIIENHGKLLLEPGDVYWNYGESFSGFEAIPIASINVYGPGSDNGRNVVRSHIKHDVNDIAITENGALIASRNGDQIQWDVVAD